MIAPAPAPREAERLAALRVYDILDTPDEQAYDDFTELAAQICESPISTITFVDETRQWFKSRVGLPGRGGPREYAFCAHAIVDNQFLMVPDATKDVRFNDNPLVLGDPDIRFYAGAPLVNPEGHGLGTLCVIDRKPRTLSDGQQRALQALARQLMALLELRRALRLLDEAQQAKKMFVANVSHELRTPLTSIRGSLALVLDSEPTLDPDSKQLLSAGHRNAERLLALVNDLLDLERVGSGQLSVEKRDCGLAAILDRAADTVRPIAADLGVSLEIAPTPIQMHADPDRLMQVLINLLANAIRFSPRGGTVSVGVQQSGDRVRITIDDQGPGVPKDFRDSIFEPFKQVEGSKLHKKGGTGLGLAISKAIVHEHGGGLGVDEAPGGGARFWFELPLRS